MQVHTGSTATNVRQEAGIAAILLLFAMSSFAVLTIGALSTGLGAAAAGKAFTLFRSMPEDAFLKFVAPLVVPEDWRTENAKGAYAFTLPVIVPETGADENGSTSAWHTMTEVPGMAVCCEARAGACNDRHRAGGGAPVVDWIPGADDALRMSFVLESRPDAALDPARGDMVTATVTSAPAGGTTEDAAVACQLEWDGAVIARGTALLRQVARDGGTSVAGKAVAGSMSIQVKTK